MNARAWFYSTSFHASTNEFDREAIRLSEQEQPRKQVADQTEYCVKCGIYHNPPTYPVDHPTQGKGDRL